MLHNDEPYRAPDPASLDQHLVLLKAKRVIAQLRKLGYTVSLTPPAALAHPATG
jgi:hypothetical protein